MSDLTESTSSGLGAGQLAERARQESLRTGGSCPGWPGPEILPDDVVTGWPGSRAPEWCLDELL